MGSALLNLRSGGMKLIYCITKSPLQKYFAKFQRWLEGVHKSTLQSFSSVLYPDVSRPTCRRDLFSSSLSKGEASFDLKSLTTVAVSLVKILLMIADSS